MIAAPVAATSWPVGSSAVRSRGEFASARSKATRYCYPPDSSSGRERSRPAMPTVDASAGAAAQQPVPVVVDSRLATTTGTGEFTLDVDGVAVPVSVIASPAAGPGYINGPRAMALIKNPPQNQAVTDTNFETQSTVSPP
jgi:hypothetical protein